MPDPSPLQISALQIARGIAAGELSPSAVITAHIERIEAVNPLINALVAERFERARAEARALDARLRGGAELPLAGVPFTVKEMIAAEGMPHTFGCVNRAGRTADVDATSVARLRAAGAILLGVTNVPEWGMWFETFNGVYGRTSNPHQPDRTCGGSSGGEGALVAAGGSAFGIGTDIGGSIRIPAAFCGVYGHKPSNGLVPLTGAYPVYAANGPAHAAAPYLTMGPLARSAADLRLIMSIIAGRDGVDPNARDLVLSDTPVDWRGRHVVVLSAPRIRRAADADTVVQDAVVRAARALEARGAIVEEAPVDLFRDAADAWFASLQSVGGPPFAEIVGEGRRVAALWEVVAALVGRSHYSWPALYFLLGERIGQKGARALAAALHQRDRMAERVSALIGRDGVLVMPAHPRTAPRHNSVVLRPLDFLYTAALNALRLPATVAPAGFDDDGLPLAVQFASADGNDDLTVAAAGVLEEEQAPWQPAAVQRSRVRTDSHAPAPKSAV
jgi:fatty acid amide hydrolase 2